MKRVSGICFCLFFMSTTLLFAQKQKKPAALPAGPAIEFKKYSYPFYTIINGNTTTLTGCFIKVKDSTYFVTARHHFYTPVNEMRKLSNVMIFVEPDNKKSNAKALSLNMKIQRLIPVCIDSVCTDIVLLPITIPNDYSIHYAELPGNEKMEGHKMTIAGYVQDSINITETKFHSIVARDSSYFLTDHSVSNEQTGSPVLMASGAKGKPEVVLAGIYSGRELSKEHFNKGLVASASVIHAYFFPAPKPVLTAPVKQIHKKKKKA